MHICLALKMSKTNDTYFNEGKLNGKRVEKWNCTVGMAECTLPGDKLGVFYARIKKLAKLLWRKPNTASEQFGQFYPNQVCPYCTKMRKHLCWSLCRTYLLAGQVQVS